LQQASTVLGGLVVVGFVVFIARRGLLVTWHGQPPALRARPRLFWSTFLGVTGGFVVVTALLAWQFTMVEGTVSVIGVRLLISAGLGLLAGAAAVRRAQHKEQQAILRAKDTEWKNSIWTDSKDEPDL
jgi:hypothetical protein